MRHRGVYVTFSGAHSSYMECEPRPSVMGTAVCFVSLMSRPHQGIRSQELVGVVSAHPTATAPEVRVGSRRLCWAGSRWIKGWKDWTMNRWSPISLCSSASEMSTVVLYQNAFTGILLQARCPQFFSIGMHFLGSCFKDEEMFAWSQEYHLTPSSDPENSTSGQTKGGTLPMTQLKVPWEWTH